jgi:hypothetical protein
LWPFLAVRDYCRCLRFSAQGPRKSPRSGDMKRLANFRGEGWGLESRRCRLGLLARGRLCVRPSVRGFATKTCRRRSGRLYLPTGQTVFRCRPCYELTYQSAQQHSKRLDELRAALSWVYGWKSKDIGQSLAEA